MEQLQADLAPVPSQDEGRPSIEEVYRDGWAHVWRTVRRLGVHEDNCDDVSQEVFVRVARLLPGYEPRNRLLPWLSAIALRTVMEHRRRHRDRIEVLLDRTVDLGDLPVPAGVDTLHARRELVLYLLHAVEPDRDMLVLHHVDEVPIAEIAAGLGVSEKAVEARLAKAREQFRAAWRRYEVRVRRETGSAPVLPIFGSLAMLEVLRDLPIPQGTGERIWARLQHVEHGGGSGVGGPRVAPHRSAAVKTLSAVALPMTAALVVVFELGMLVGLRLNSPALLPVPVEATSGAVAAAITAPAPAPIASNTASVTAATVAPASGTPNQVTEEVFITRAASAIAESRFADALDAVQEHARYCRHRGCTQRYAAETARIHALIGAGRLDEARVWIESFAASHPDDRRPAQWRAQVGVAP